jgi:type II secretory pathway pseudopilin PulG
MRNGDLGTRSRGFTFLGLLVAITVVGFSLAEAGNTWSNIQRREREQELLKVGDKIRMAIGNYYNQSPGMVKQYPPNLEVLLKDDRFPTPKRYLRKLYADPLTGRTLWGVLEAPSGGVMGVYSLSTGKPFKTKGFPERFKTFENRKYYMQWIFAYVPELDTTAGLSSE